MSTNIRKAQIPQNQNKQNQPTNQTHREKKKKKEKNYGKTNRKTNYIILKQFVKEENSSNNLFIKLFSIVIPLSFI